jgi:hypothetical protein
MSRILAVSGCSSLRVLGRVWRIPNGPPPPRKQPRGWRQAEKQQQSPVSGCSLVHCPVTPAVHVTRCGIEVAEARNDVFIRGPAVTTRSRPRQRFLAVDSPLEQDLAAAHQHSTRGSLRHARRPARKPEGGAVRLPGASITIGHRTARQLIVNRVTPHPGYRRPHRQKARQHCRNGEQAPLHPRRLSAVA